MSEVIEYLEKQIRKAEDQLRQAKLLIDIMRDAGEDVSGLELQYSKLKRKVDMYRAALERAKRALAK